MRGFIPKARILVSVPTLEYMVRGGRVSPLKGAAAKLLNLKPIVSLDPEGASVLHGKVFSEKSNRRKILEMVARDLEEAPLRCYAVLHAEAEEAARLFAADLERVIGRPPSTSRRCRPTSGSTQGRAPWR